jgi:hypothetical protein
LVSPYTTSFVKSVTGVPEASNGTPPLGAVRSAAELAAHVTRTEAVGAAAAVFLEEGEEEGGEEEGSEDVGGELEVVALKW